MSTSVVCGVESYHNISGFISPYLWCLVSYLDIYLLYFGLVHVPDVWIDISISIVSGVEYYPHICGVFSP